MNVDLFYVFVKNILKILTMLIVHKSTLFVVCRSICMSNLTALVLDYNK